MAIQQVFCTFNPLSGLHVLIAMKPLLNGVYSVRLSSLVWEVGTPWARWAQLNMCASSPSFCDVACIVGYSVYDLRVGVSDERPPSWRQPRGNSMVNSHTNATRIGWHLWEIEIRFAPGLPPGWREERNAGMKRWLRSSLGQVLCPRSQSRQRVEWGCGSMR